MKKRTPRRRERIGERHYARDVDRYRRKLFDRRCGRRRAPIHLFGLRFSRMARRHADPHRRRSERGQTDARRSSSSRLRYSEASRSGRRRRSSRQQGFLRTFESEHLAVAARRHSQPQHLDARRQTLACSDDQHPRYRFDRFGWRGIGAHRRRGRRPGNGQPSGHPPASRCSKMPRRLRSTEHAAHSE